MGFHILHPDTFDWITRPHEPGEAARHVAELSDLARVRHTRANVWRYEPGAAGRRHRHEFQEETFVGSHTRGVRARLHTFTAYSIGCAVVWAVLLPVVWIVDPPHTFHMVLTVFGGWVIGWTSATIARWVYPPPRSRGPR